MEMDRTYRVRANKPKGQKVVFHSREYYWAYSRCLSIFLDGFLDLDSMSKTFTGQFNL